MSDALWSRAPLAPCPTSLSSQHRHSHAGTRHRSLAQAHPGRRPPQASLDSLQPPQQRAQQQREHHRSRLGRQRLQPRVQPPRPPQHKHRPSRSEAQTTQQRSLQPPQHRRSRSGRQRLPQQHRVLRRLPQLRPRPFRLGEQPTQGRRPGQAQACLPCLARLRRRPLQGRASLGSSRARPLTRCSRSSSSSRHSSRRSCSSSSRSSCRRRWASCRTTGRR